MMCLQNLNVEVFWVARYDYQSGRKLRNHEHDHYQMIYVLDGGGEFNLDQNQYPIRRDQLFLIQPGQLHGLIPNEDSVLKTLDIKFIVLDPCLNTALKNLDQRVFEGESEFKSLFEKIREEGMHKRPFYKEVSSNYLNQMLLLLLRFEKAKEQRYVDDFEQESQEEFDKLTIMALEYIKNNYMKPMNLKDLAQAIGYNKNYICERLKKSLGHTPMSYLYLYRIYKARELIKYSDYSLKEIASLSGFESIHHFTRLFRRYEGIAPGQWRDRERDGVRKDIYFSDEFENLNFTGWIK